MTVLVTGSGGFLGRYVVEALQTAVPDDTIIRWSRDQHGSLLDSADRLRALDLLEPEKVLSLAWASTGRPGYEHDASHAQWAEATVEFVQEAAERSAWFAVVGSGADSAYSETSMSAYRQAKIDLRERLSGLMNGDRVAYLRPFYLFSAFDLRPRVLREYLLRDRTAPFELRTPQSMHDFIHVEDAARGIALAASEGMTGIVNVGTGVLRDVAELLRATDPNRSDVGRSLPTRVAPSSDQPTMLRARGWTPTVTERIFESNGDGTDRMFAW